MNTERPKAIGGDDLVPIPVFLAVSLGEAAAVVAQEVYFRQYCQMIKGAGEGTEIVKVSSSDIQHKIRWMSATAVRDALRLLVAAEILVVVGGGGSAPTAYKIDDAKAKHFAQHPEDGAALRAAMKAKKPAQKNSEPNPLAKLPSEIRSVDSGNRSLVSEIRSVDSGNRSQTAPAPILEKDKDKKVINPMPTAIAPLSEPRQAQSAPDPTAKPQGDDGRARRHFEAIWHEITGVWPREANRDEVLFVWSRTSKDFGAEPRLKNPQLIDAIRTARNQFLHRDVGAAQQTSEPIPMTVPWRQGIPIEKCRIPKTDKHGTVIPANIGNGFNFDDIKRYTSGEWFVDQGTDANGVPSWDWAKEQPKRVTYDDVIKFMKTMNCDLNRACALLGVDPARFGIAS